MTLLVELIDVVHDRPRQDDMADERDHRDDECSELQGDARELEEVVLQSASRPGFSSSFFR